MGLFSSFKSLFNKEPKGRERQKDDRSSSSTGETRIKKDKSEGKTRREEERTQEVSASKGTGVSVQKKKKKQENLHKIEEREILWEMNKKIDELLEIKELYEDMLDWMVEISKKESIESDREKSRSVSTGSSKESNLSPRLRQVLEIVRDKGELNASDLSEELELSQNRCSELLNTLFKANYLSKKRVGRKVFYRVNSSNGDLEIID